MLATLAESAACRSFILVPHADKCQLLNPPLQIVDSGRSFVCAMFADDLRAHEASILFNSLNVRLVYRSSRRGFNVWLQAPLSAVLQKVCLRPAAFNGINGCRQSHTSSVLPPNRLSVNLTCGVAIVCHIFELVLTPVIILLDAGRLALAEFFAPSLPPMLDASVFMPAERHERSASLVLRISIYAKRSICGRTFEDGS